ncbi:hypothetical protein D3C78_1548290 [compost metagenome]
MFQQAGRHRVLSCSVGQCRQPVAAAETAFHRGVQQRQDLADDLCRASAGAVRIGHLQITAAGKQLNGDQLLDQRIGDCLLQSIEVIRIDQVTGDVLQRQCPILVTLCRLLSI